MADCKNLGAELLGIAVLAQHDHDGVGHGVRVGENAPLRQGGDYEAAGGALGLTVHLPRLAEVGAAWGQGGRWTGGDQAPLARKPWCRGLPGRAVREQRLLSCNVMTGGGVLR